MIVLAHTINESEIRNAGYSIAEINGENINPNTPINGTNPASCTEGPIAFCEGYSEGYPHGIEHYLGSELRSKAANHDWKLLLATKDTRLITQVREHVPPCPFDHSSD